MFNPFTLVVTQASHLPNDRMAREMVARSNDSLINSKDLTKPAGQPRTWWQTFRSHLGSGSPLRNAGQH